MKFDPKGVSEKRIFKDDIFFRLLKGETAYFVFAGGKSKPDDEQWMNYWPDGPGKWPDGTCFFDKAELDEWVEGMVAVLKERNIESTVLEQGLHYRVVTVTMTVDSVIEWGHKSVER